MSYDTATGRVRRFFVDTFGFRGSRNLTSWIVAGGVAYYFIYLPEHKRAQEIQAQREAAKRFAIEKGIQDIDRTKPIPDPQDTGLIKGVKAVARQQQQQQQQEQEQQGQEQQQQQQ